MIINNQTSHSLTNNFFSPSSEINRIVNSEFEEITSSSSLGVRVPRHDERHKDAALKVTESDSQSSRHSKPSQGHPRSVRCGPEIGHLVWLSLPRNTLDPVIQAPVCVRYLLSVDPAPACCPLSEAPPPDLVTSLPLSGPDPQTISLSSFSSQ